MVKVTNISKSFKKVKALSNFTYNFENGIYAILGPNGSGKSTLMNILTGNLVPDCGEVSIIYDDKNRRSIGYVPQYPGMYQNFTAYEMLDYIALLSKENNRSSKIEELINVFDLTDYKDKKVSALSGGTKQRLAIAQAFIGDPELILLDEPTAGLDPLQRIAFKNFISENKGNKSIIISTHIVSDVEEIADDVIFLKSGSIVSSGSLLDVTGELKGSCWRLDNKNELKENMTYRVIGDEIRILSREKPADSAVEIAPTLEECYLNIFGAEI